MSIFDEIKLKVFQSGNRTNLFIGINVFVFLFFTLLGVFEWLFTKQSTIDIWVTEYGAVPSYLPKLLYRFWTPFTYMFLHAGFFHLLFNMLWFFWFGRIFEEYLKGDKLTFVYISGGLAGAFFYIICYNLIPAFAGNVQISVAVGASAAVMAVVAATATLLPNYTISFILIGPVKLVWIAVILFVLDFMNLNSGNAGGHLAHIGGAAFGYFFIKSLQSGNDWSKPFENAFKPKSKLKTVYRNQTPSLSKNDEKPNQELIDSILDKISQSGYDKLTKKEKDILFNASKSNEEKEK